MKQDKRKTRTVITDGQLIEFGLRKRHLSIDRLAFYKTPVEKNRLRMIKRQHKRELISAGYDPKKVMNIPLHKKA